MEVEISTRLVSVVLEGIAIVSSGITGTNLALGLVNRGISCKIHERGHIFSEVDAGVRLAPNCICAITQELYFDFSGGYHDNGSEYSKVLFSFYNWEGSNSYLAESRESVVDQSDDQGPVTLFRRWHHSDSRSVELGEDMVANPEMYLGLEGHVITHPVDRRQTMNLVAFTITKEGSTDPYRSASAVTEQDTLNELTGSSRNVTTILSLLNEHVDTWAIFDMLDQPASTYTKRKKGFNRRRSTFS
ncbi:hypothetical protein BHYA_0411g00060 [Botrytis hyacinthi]|uniref:Uncharacterized protein n=1 Tax=Botrytis hyacinthi TaxID=278943 RepID=A0A4Z1GC36_9HELO|nr:hypothetical protein BHYA_0411g00060 [Botrytis hyacinthi]